MDLWGFCAMDVTKPFGFMGFGGIHGPKPNKLKEFRWAFVSQTPVVLLNLFPRPHYFVGWFIGQDLDTEIGSGQGPTWAPLLGPGRCRSMGSETI